jgi:hypothetical protein
MDEREWAKPNSSSTCHEQTKRKEEQRRENVKSRWLLGLCTTC